MTVQSSIACIRYLKGTEVIKFTLFNWSFQISGLTVCFTVRMDRNGMETQFSLKKKKQIGCILTFLICISPLSSQERFFQYSAQPLCFHYFLPTIFLFLRKTSKVNKEIKTYFLPAVLFQIFQYSIKERQKLQTTVEEHC